MERGSKINFSKDSTLALSSSNCKQAFNTLPQSVPYRQSIETSPIAIAIHSEGKIVFANKAAVKMLGGTVDQLIGKPAIDFVHPDYKEQVYARIHKMLTERVPAPLLDEKFIGLDGRIIDVAVTALPFVYKGKPAVMVMAQDISERKYLEQQLRESKQLSEALNVINTAISSTLDFDMIMRTVVVKSVTVIGAETAVILLKKKDYWVASYMHGLHDSYTGQRFTKEQVRASELATKTKRPVVINDAYSDKRVNHAMMRQFKIRSMLVVPLIVKEEVIGSLVSSITQKLCLLLMHRLILQPN